ncbi:hypothetical protein F4823DRAFT_605418 [Ustulina deusta]|nr:hypothetical protein F4823DRAFT_605418 [Ustulina deusta]
MLKSLFSLSSSLAQIFSRIYTHWDKFIGISFAVFIYLLPRALRGLLWRLIVTSTSQSISRATVFAKVLLFIVLGLFLLWRVCLWGLMLICFSQRVKRGGFL